MNRLCEARAMNIFQVKRLSRSFRASVWSLMIIIHRLEASFFVIFTCGLSIWTADQTDFLSAIVNITYVNVLMWVYYKSTMLLAIIILPVQYWLPPFQAFAVHTLLVAMWHCMNNRDYRISSAMLDIMWIQIAHLCCILSRYISIPLSFNRCIQIIIIKNDDGKFF